MPSPVAIRPTQPEDVPAIVELVHALAAYEREPDSCHLTQPQLHTALFSEHPALYGHVATIDGAVVGFTLWFLNFSTWEGTHGIYLEDLFVRPEARGAGVGRALLTTLAAICVERGYRRLDWWVLNWNPAREFYARIGSTGLEEWVPYRLTGDALAALASGAGPRADT